MVGEAALWSKIRDTRHVATELNERFVKRGRFEMHETAWSAHSQGEDGRRYTICVAEYEPESILAEKLFHTKPSILAAISEYEPTDGSQVVSGVELVAGKLALVDFGFSSPAEGSGVPQQYPQEPFERTLQRFSAEAA